MEEIVPIRTTSKGSIVVSGRDLHAALEIKTDFTDWMKRMLEYGFIENEDFLKKEEPVNQFVTKHDYVLKIDMAKEIAMIQRTEIGRTVRKYFLECEKAALSQSPSLPDFSNPAIAARAWADQFEGRLIAEKKIEEDAPKVKAAEIMLMSDDSITVSEFAKSVNRGPIKLYKAMRDDKLLIDSGNRHNLPYQKFIDAGYFTVREKSEVINNKVKLFHQTMITPKGQIYLSNKYGKSDGQ